MSASEYRTQAAKPKRSKYGAQKTVVDNIRFDSKREAEYYAELQLRARAGEVVGVELQRPFPLIVGNGEVIGTYKSDFCYFDCVEDRFRVIDVKGYDTAVSKLKRKIVRAVYGVEVEIIK